MMGAGASSQPGPFWRATVQFLEDFQWNYAGHLKNAACYASDILKNVEKVSNSLR